MMTGHKSTLDNRIQ